MLLHFLMFYILGSSLPGLRQLDPSARRAQIRLRSSLQKFLLPTHPQNQGFEQPFSFRCSDDDLMWLDHFCEYCLEFLGSFENCFGILKLTIFNMFGVSLFEHLSSSARNINPELSIKVCNWWPLETDSCRWLWRLFSRLDSTQSLHLRFDIF